MAFKNSILFRSIFFIGCLYTAFYLLACATPFINPVHGYFFSFYFIRNAWLGIA